MRLLENRKQENTINRKIEIERQKIEKRKQKVESRKIERQ